MTSTSYVTFLFCVDKYLCHFGTGCWTYVFYWVFLCVFSCVKVALLHTQSGSFAYLKWRFRHAKMALDIRQMHNLLSDFQILHFIMWLSSTKSTIRYSCKMVNNRYDFPHLRIPVTTLIILLRWHVPACPDINRDLFAL